MILPGGSVGTKPPKSAQKRPGSCDGAGVKWENEHLALGLPE